MLRSLWLSVCLVALFSFPAHAQVIHGHPQCSQYVDDATPIDPGVTCHLPPLVSAQCHWDDPVLLAVANTLEHTHTEFVKPPLYGEISGPFTIAFQYQLFHLQGALDETRFEGELVRRLVWDATGTSTPPSLAGDPTGIVILTGHVTFDPALSDHTDQSPGNVPPRGWWTARLKSVTRFVSGATTVQELAIPLYSLIDPSAPETVSRFSLRSRCQGNSATSVPVAYGTPAVEFLNTYIPLAPIDHPWTTTVLSYEYGNQSLLLAPGTFEQRLDMNLHLGIPGTLISSEVSSGGDPNGNVVTFDPAVAGTGDHKMAFTWDQKSGAGNADFTPNEEVTALLVVPWTASSGGVSGPPVDCVVTPWTDVSTSTTFSPAVTSGSIQTRMVTMTLMQQRTILTPASNGGAACPVN